jgi:CRP-like cAMP-binding protein
MKIFDQGFLTEYDDVKGDVWSEYLAALYWAMTTLTTVGYGDIIPTTNVERAYCILSMVIGGGFYGYVVGSITSVVASDDLNNAVYYERLDLFQAWLAHHRFPTDLQRGLKRHYKAYLGSQSAIPDEAQVWHELSPEWQKEVGEFMLSESVRYNPMFDGISVGVMVQFQCKLKQFTIPEGHTITEAGEVGSAMYIVNSGWLSLYLEKQEEEEARDCPGGCGFIVTWHPTHCCRNCAEGTGIHGRRCDRISSLTLQPVSSDSNYRPTMTTGTLTQWFGKQASQEENSQPISQKFLDGRKDKYVVSGSTTSLGGSAGVGSASVSSTGVGSRIVQPPLKKTLSGESIWGQMGDRVKLGPDQSFGEEVLLGLEDTYRYSVVVDERASLDTISESEFNEMFASRPNEVERMRQNARWLHESLSRRAAGKRLFGDSTATNTLEESLQREES